MKAVPCEHLDCGCVIALRNGRVIFQAKQCDRHWPGQHVDAEQVDFGEPVG